MHADSNMRKCVLSRETLAGLERKHEYFAGIDSDGCVFPTMELKQKQCIHPLICSYWRLDKYEGEVRAAAEFVNLYSVYRGSNRFRALLLTMDFLRGMGAMRRARASIPRLAALKRFVASGRALSNAELAKAVRETGDCELAHVLDWSRQVNAAIARTARSVPPFKWARESLKAIARDADAICVSQTPAEALRREWQRNRLAQYIRAIAGQELGSKADHIRLATRGRYPAHRILVIGDALGDLAAARANRARFYPITPGREEESWELFRRDTWPRFIAGDYSPAYEKRLVQRFKAMLPSSPPWARKR